MNYEIVFKTPVQYYVELLKENPDNINKMQDILKDNPEWLDSDGDLHIYPYVDAVPALLTAGCKNSCKFCPSYQYYKGRTFAGDYELVLNQLKNKQVHFMDEDFSNNDLDKIFPLIKKNNIQCLFMTTPNKFQDMINNYGEDYLYQHGVRAVEMGLENIIHMNKVKNFKIKKPEKIQILFLNISFFDGETKESLRENAKFIKQYDPSKLMYYNNYNSYGTGQFYFEYDANKREGLKEKGIVIESRKARTSPTFVPNSFLNEDFEIIDLEKTNHYSLLSNSVKFIPKKNNHNIFNFCGYDTKKYKWLVTGIKCGGIK